ncbi:MAG: hypothetical protein ACLVJ6_14035 [Merdibacter sp.]
MSCRWILVGSVHSIDGLLYDMPFSQPLLWQKYEHQAIVDRYLDCVLQSVQSRLFDQIGHRYRENGVCQGSHGSGRIREMRRSSCGDCAGCSTGCHWRYAHPDFGLSDLG